MSQKCVIQPVALSAIHIRVDARRLETAAVASLAESMREIGLLSPVRVRMTSQGYELCAGHHRYQAAVSLGWEEIDAIVEAYDDLDAELVMIDENLCRQELSAVDRAHYTARRKAIYLEKHPETAHGGNNDDRVAKFATRETPSFSADTAKKTGESERVVRLHAERGEKVAPDVLKRIKGTFLDNGVYLDGLKKLSHHDQRTKIACDIMADMKRRSRRKKGTKAVVSGGERVSFSETPHHVTMATLARRIAACGASAEEIIASCPNYEALTDLLDACDRARAVLTDICHQAGSRRAA